MKVTIQPSWLKGIVQAPASKSSMQRACAAALLVKGTTMIYNPGHSNDDKAALDIIQRLGAKVVDVNGEWRISSSGVYPVSSEINCGESGLSIRMFTPIAALSDKEITINGSGSLAIRPMDFFDEILPALNVNVKSQNGKLPLVIQGPLKPANIVVDGSLSSQFLTGLLMAYGAPSKSPPVGETFKNSNSNKTVTITVKNLKSKPYIDLTLNVMKKFGFNVPENHNYEEFIFYKDSWQDSSPGASERSGNGEQSSLEEAGFSYIVEGDWSGGAFLLVAGAISGPVTVRGLDLTSTQADKVIVDALMSANAGIAMEAKGIRVHPAEMNGFEFDATNCPDLFPPLVALAAYCNGETKIKGVSRLTHKESNRALTLKEEFGKMGMKIELNDDVMIIQGGYTIKGANNLHSHHDHRIAMACAIAACKADGETVIDESQAVEKSYPDFYEDLKKLGADVSLSNKFSWHE